MEYAKLLQESAGKFDYRESPLKTVMKVNDLRKTIDKDGRANIIRKEPYANKIATYLSNEELKQKINLGAGKYKAGVQQMYNDYQLEKLKNDPLKYIEKARKQVELAKIFNNPSQLEYLRKTDPVGLFYLEQAQEDEKEEILRQQKEERDRIEQENRDKLQQEQEIRRQQELQEQEIRRQQEEAKQEGIRQAVVGPPLGELGQYFKGPRKVEVNSQGNITINGQSVAIPIAVAKLKKFAPELTDTMSAKQIVSTYRDSQIRQASERAGLSLPRFKAELNRRKDAERIQRFKETKEQEEGPIISGLFDDEQPIVEQHAEELMDENPELTKTEAQRHAEENVLRAREYANKLQSLVDENPNLNKAMQLYSKKRRDVSTEQLIEGVVDHPEFRDQILKDYALSTDVPQDIPSIKLLKKYGPMSLRALAEKNGILYDANTTDKEIFQALVEKKKGIKHELGTTAIEPDYEQQEYYDYERKLTMDAIRYALMKDRNLDKATFPEEVLNNPALAEAIRQEYVREQIEPLPEPPRRPPIPEEKTQPKMTDEEIANIGKELRGQEVAPLPVAIRQVTESTFRGYTVDKMKQFFTDNGVNTKKFNFKDRQDMLHKARQLKLIKSKGKGFELKGSGFRSLASYPHHIIAGALNIVKRKKKLRINQNEYNREQAHKLTQKVLHGGAFF